MIRLAWRQFRTPAVVSAGALLVVAVFAAVSGRDLANAPSSRSPWPSRSGPICSSSTSRSPASIRSRGGSSCGRSATSRPNRA